KELKPGPNRRLAVLLDHLVSGAKEEYIASEAMQAAGARDNVLIVGHPYVDIRQASKREGRWLRARRSIPRNEAWKTGLFALLGLTNQNPSGIGLGWKKLLSRVNNFADLEAALLGRVEHMIDFVTVAE